MDENQTIDQDRIKKVNIEVEMKRSYIDYSMSVIVARALPDVRDGFKPGIKVDAIGEMNLSAHNGKINLSCKVEELTQYVADSSNYNQ
jgi:hypothetical protein